MALTVNVKGGYWGDQGATFQLENRNYHNRQVAQILDREGQRGQRARMFSLNGAAAGGAVSASHRQIKAGEADGGFFSELGGARTIETVTDESGVTAAADETEIDSTILDYVSEPTYPANGDGNPRGYPGG